MMKKTSMIGTNINTVEGNFSFIFQKFITLFFCGLSLLTVHNYTHLISGTNPVHHDEI